MAQHDHWPTKAEAARRLDTSIRNIERLIARGDIESSKPTQPGRKPITIVNPDDLARMHPPAHVMPPETGETRALQRATLHQQTQPQRGAARCPAAPHCDRTSRRTSGHKTLADAGGSGRPEWTQ
ncbi:MAG: hypothetical protein JOZ62_06135 [Acidobacteriaceae bacterium]|nr:hypothetical protein [Acidobacteriaceae bacterium]